MNFEGSLLIVEVILKIWIKLSNKCFILVSDPWKIILNCEFALPSYYQLGGPCLGHALGAVRGLEPHVRKTLLQDGS